jgi:hypothetical protein
MDFQVNVTVPDLSVFEEGKLVESLHDEADEIARTIMERIKDRTPRWTGALRGDEDYKLGSGRSLVTWFVNPDYQLTEWKREYDIYQEGPPLGLETYTRGEHQMFFQVSTTDLPLIAEWAERVVNGGVESMVEDANAGATEMSL